MKVSQIVLATGLIGHATATWNMFGNPFNSPNYNDNECSDKQKGGFDWSDLKDGDSNFNYGDFDFTGGWKCSNSFGKRDHLTRRTFGSKCIKNKVSKTKPASFGCNKRKSGFSITHIDVSVEYDVDIELHYHMEDGSKCKQVAPCKSSGSTIQNTQCGGAKSVDVYLPKHDKSDKECEIGFHNIGFDCNPGQGYNSPSPPSPPEIPASSAPVISQPASSAPVVSAPFTSAAPPSSTPSCDGEQCNTQPPATSSAAPPCDGGENCPPATSSAAPPCDGGENCPPATSAPATEVPSTDASVPTPPATETPETPCGGYGQESCEGTTVVSSAPATETPATETPATETPATETPATETPATETPATETPATETPATSAPPVTETPETPCGGYGQESCEGTTVVTSAPATETPAPSAPPVTETPCGGYGQESCEGTTVVTSAPAETPILSTAPFTNSSAPATTAPPTEETTPAQPPVSESPSAPACDGSYGESCEGTTAVVTPPASSSIILTTGVPAPSSPPAPPVSPPDVLPKCMNTWLEVSGDCKNNADASCYCKNKDFTKQVIDCVSAWCGTDDETREALQYLIGICAEHVPENPGLVTDCPTYIPLNPTPATPTAPAGGVSTPAGETGTTPAPEVPGTTPAPEVPSGGVTGQVPAETPAPSTPCTTIVYGTTTLTIPQVHFTTQTNAAGGASPTEPVGLVQGTAPAQTPASTTSAGAAPYYPISGTTLATFKPTGTGAYSPTAPAEFTGAAAVFGVEARHVVLGAVVAFLAL